MVTEVQFWVKRKKHPLSFLSMWIQCIKKHFKELRNLSGSRELWKNTGSTFEVTISLPLFLDQNAAWNLEVDTKIQTEIQEPSSHLLFLSVPSHSWLWSKCQVVMAGAIVRAHKNPNSENRELSLQSTILFQSVAFAGFVLFSLSSRSWKRELHETKKYLEDHTKEGFQESSLIKNEILASSQLLDAWI